MRLNRKKVLQLMLEQDIGTQAELAEAIGVSRQTMSGWLNGLTLTMDNLASLCSTLKCTPNDILVWDETPKADAPVVDQRAVA